MVFGVDETLKIIWEGKLPGPVSIVSDAELCPGSGIVPFKTLSPRVTVPLASM
jgi:hypothetical protein